MRAMILVDEYYKKKIRVYSKGQITIQMFIKNSIEKDATCDFVRLTKDELMKIRQFVFESKEVKR